MPEHGPIACSLDGDAARRRWADWASVLAARVSVELDPELLTVRFPPSADLSTRLGALVAAERECCGFVDWALEDRAANFASLSVAMPGVLAMAESFGSPHEMVDIPVATFGSDPLDRDGGLWSTAVNNVEVVDLVGVDQLAQAFNQADSDSPRLLLLLSPT